MKIRNIVTISGDRQAGKTHAALALAATDFRLGRRVVWVSNSWDAARYVLDSLASDFLPYARPHRTSGRYRISDDDDSGEIVFHSEFAKSLAYKDTDHTFIFDDTRLPFGFAADNPNARIYVTVIPPGGEDFMYADDARLAHR